MHLLTSSPIVKWMEWHCVCCISRNGSKGCQMKSKGACHPLLRACHHPAVRHHCKSRNRQSLAWLCGLQEKEHHLSQFAQVAQQFGNGWPSVSGLVPALRIFSFKQQVLSSSKKKNIKRCVSCVRRLPTLEPPRMMKGLFFMTYHALNCAQRQKYQ